MTKGSQEASVFGSAAEVSIVERFDAPISDTKSSSATAHEWWRQRRQDLTTLRADAADPGYVESFQRPPRATEIPVITGLARLEPKIHQFLFFGLEPVPCGPPSDVHPGNRSSIFLNNLQKPVFHS